MMLTAGQKKQSWTLSLLDACPLPGEPTPQGEILPFTPEGKGPLTARFVFLAEERWSERGKNNLLFVHLEGQSLNRRGFSP